LAGLILIFSWESRIPALIIIEPFPVFDLEDRFCAIRRGESSNLTQDPRQNYSYNY
jgi:hypothetical protein